MRIWAIPVISVLIIIGTVSWGTIGWWFGIFPLALAALAIAALIAAAHPRVQARQQQRQDAERITAQLLRNLQGHGHRVLHARAVPDSPTGIDHLVVGPNGVYALASKKWQRQIPVRTKYRNLFHGPVSQRQLLDETAAGARRAQDVLSGSIGQLVPVRPAVVVHGPHVPWKVLAIRGVDVISGKRLRRYLDKRDRKLSTVEIERITAAAEEALPPRNRHRGAAMGTGSAAA